MECVNVLSCVVGDRELIQQVLFDAVVTAPLEAYWTGLALNKSEWVGTFTFYSFIFTKLILKEPYFIRLSLLDQRVPPSVCLLNLKRLFLQFIL